MSTFDEDFDHNPYRAPKADPSYASETARLGYGGIGARFVAILLDSIIMGVAGGVLGAVLGVVLFLVGVPIEIMPIFTFPSGILLSIVYYGGMVSSESQATLGKMAMGLKITDLHGRRISFGRAVGREFAKFFSAFTLMIGYLMAFFTERRQTLHDKIAGTLVVRTR